MKLKLEQFSDSVKRYIHSEKNLSQANGSHGIFYGKMITDLKSEIKFLRDQVSSKGTSYFHEEIRFLCQQLETAHSKQEHSNIGFCNNRHGQHIRHIGSNIVHSDKSFIMIIILKQ